MSVGTPVGYVSASDDDIGINAQRTYEIVGGGLGSQYFYMDSVYSAGTGVVKVKQVRRDFFLTSPTKRGEILSKSDCRFLHNAQ